MIGFDIYMPVAWIEDGLLKRISRKQPVDFKRQSRRGKWTIGSSVLMISASAMISMVILPTVPNRIAEIDVLATKPKPVSLRPEEHKVPDQYWDRLGEAIMSVARLPAQDISKDPPILV